MAKLQLVGGIDEETTEKVLEALLPKPKALTIYLNTSGGDAYQMMEICDIIMSAQETTITVHAYGTCMSAGIWILNAADVRLATPECLFLIHHGDETSDSTQLKKLHNRMFKKMKKMLSDKMSVSATTVGRYFSRETYMTAEEALRAGLIDEVRSAVE